MTFEDIQRRALAEDDAGKVTCVYVGTATCGQGKGALEVLESIKAGIAQAEVKARVIEVGCLGACHLEPLVAVAKPGGPRVWYGSVSPEATAQLVADYVAGDNPRPDLALGTTGDDGIDGIPRLLELPFFQPQVSVARRNCGYVDPDSLNSYLVAEGYSGFAKALQMSPEDIIEEISRSGLRGRGGAGFATGEKWRTCRQAEGEEKYVICNAHEADTGVATGHTLLEGDPHAVLEGMLIAARAVGAGRGYIYLNAANTLAVERLRMALKQVKETGLLGDNILGSGFGFSIEIREGAADLICGEETAMLRSMEGQRAMPYPRPPYPATSGLEGKPTCINNVETLAAVSAILQQGAAWYAGFGTGESRGTKVFALSGVARPGIIEVPLGTTLRQVIYDIGGGVLESKDFKVALVGGPTGGCLAGADLDKPLDYGPLAEAGAIVGPGAVSVFSNDFCAVDLARNCLAFAKEESCGECVLGREGTSQMLEILTDITEGKAKPEDIDILLDLGTGLRAGSLCALGRTAPNPVLTTLERFRDEYELHVKKKQCPAGVCRKLASG